MLEPEDVSAILGADRLAEMREAVEGLAGFREMTWNAATTDFVCRPLNPAEFSRWGRMAPSRGVAIGYPPEPIEGVDTVFYVMDEASDAGLADPEAATIYPSVHSMMTSWWLVHAWRTIDLLDDASLSLMSWRVTSAAVAGRALIEQVGCLNYEATLLAKGWEAAKFLDDSRSPGVAVFEDVRPVLIKAAVSTRMNEPSPQRTAVNVMTYVSKLVRATGDERYNDWYEWLTETAHPAYGARVANSSPAMSDGSILVRSYARQPMWVMSPTGERLPSEHPIAPKVLETVIACATAASSLLRSSLALVDDFGLTTAAGTLTRRSYFRQLTPQRGRKHCPCGCGPWSDSGHFWGQSAPLVAVAG